MSSRENPRIPFVEYYLRRFVRKDYRILDLGCGRGQYRGSTEATYIGLDVTDDPYSANVARAPDIVACGTKIPSPGSTYDLVFCVGALYQMPEPLQVISEIHRVLTPNGRVLLFDYNRRTQKRLEIGEGHKRPCWTQWRLRDLLQGAGFRKCELLLPTGVEAKGLIGLMRLMQNEFLAQWIIVTGVKWSDSRVVTGDIWDTDANPF